MRLVRVVRLDCSHLGSFVAETSNFSLRSQRASLALPARVRARPDANEDFAMRINIFESTSEQWDPVSGFGTAAGDPPVAAPPATCSRCSSRSSGLARISAVLSSASASNRSPNASEGLSLNSLNWLECETCFF